MQKGKVIEIINQLPDEVELDCFIEKLIFIQQIEAADKQIDDGESFTQDEVELISSKW